jgi:hypothetical protein
VRTGAIAEERQLPIRQRPRSDGANASSGEESHNGDQQGVPRMTRSRIGRHRSHIHQHRQDCTAGDTPSVRSCRPQGTET